jgi:hypothetical protein
LAAIKYEVIVYTGDVSGAGTNAIFRLHHAGQFYWWIKSVPGENNQPAASQ